MPNRGWLNNPDSSPFKLLQFLAAISHPLPDSDERLVYCGARYLLKSGQSQGWISSAMFLLRRDGYVITSCHYHRDSRTGNAAGGVCANQRLTEKAIDLVTRQAWTVGAVSWTGDPNPVDFERRPTATGVRKKASDDGQPVVIPKVVSTVLTEQEEQALHLLTSLSHNVSLGGHFEKRVVAPDGLLVKHQFVGDSGEAIRIVESLAVRGYLKLIAVHEDDDDSRPIYQIVEQRVSEVRAVSPRQVETELQKRHRQHQRRLDNLLERRAHLVSEREALDSAINEMDLEIRQVRRTLDLVNRRMQQFSDLLREFADEGLAVSDLSSHERR